MEYKILHKGAYPLVEVNLGRGERLKAESGAMVAMSNTIDVDGKMEGGLMAGLGRLLAGEKFFFQTLNASRGDGTVLLAPSSTGDIVDITLDGSHGMCVQKDGFLAGQEGIEVSTNMQNLAKGIFSGEGFFILKISGKGHLFLNSFGAIHELNLQPGEEMIVDNSHLVAWADYMDYTIEKASKGWISSFTSGEGLVCKFRGPGKVYIQSRNPGSFGTWLKPYIPMPSGK
ncbi:TIGR00266 family protein [Anaeromicrobium sediminis]|uniref:TIGR00266 family protein n=1 Tax=Anaeromicrobium sediminis TaxID=1478221 RepID=A0A267MM06_9FIRM|nr:TIGR00266 family protein [Anaeromicrobium sediminis]PAB59938.1 TIGR00266 family protein [Anaeromicrobium sediminis]